MGDSRSPPIDDISSGGSGPIRKRYDWAATSPLRAAIQTVAVATDREPTSLPVLNEAIDPDALNTLCEQDETGRDDAGIKVSFSYAGCEVTMTGDGIVTVQAPEK